MLAANPPIAGFDPGLDDEALTTAVATTDIHTLDEAVDLTAQAVGGLGFSGAAVIR